MLTHNDRAITWTGKPWTAATNVVPARLDVWRLRFGDAPPLSVAWALLNEVERRRADAFMDIQDRWRFVWGRAFLRRVLGLQTYQDPKEVALSVGEHGKPALANSSDGLRFNLSHCRTECLVGVIEGYEVGVDIEDRHLVPERNQLAGHYLSRHEQAALVAAPLETRNDLFLRCWTRKEAVLKAAGAGFLGTSNELDVKTGIHDETVQFDSSCLGECASYRVFDLSQQAVIAAIAVREHAGPVAIRERTLDPGG